MVRHLPALGFALLSLPLHCVWANPQNQKPQTVSISFENVFKQLNLSLTENGISMPQDSMDDLFGKGISPQITSQVYPLTGIAASPNGRTVAVQFDRAIVPTDSQYNESVFVLKIDNENNANIAKRFDCMPIPGAVDAVATGMTFISDYIIRIECVGDSERRTIRNYQFFDVRQGQIVYDFARNSGLSHVEDVRAYSKYHYGIANIENGELNVQLFYFDPTTQVLNRLSTVETSLPKGDATPINQDEVVIKITEARGLKLKKNSFEMVPLRLVMSNRVLETSEFVINGNGEVYTINDSGIFIFENGKAKASWTFNFFHSFAGPIYKVKDFYIGKVRGGGYYKLIPGNPGTAIILTPENYEIVHADVTQNFVIGTGEGFASAKLEFIPLGDSSFVPGDSVFNDFFGNVKAAADPDIRDAAVPKRSKYVNERFPNKLYTLKQTSPTRLKILYSSGNAKKQIELLNEIFSFEFTDGGGLIISYPTLHKSQIYTFGRGEFFGPVRYDCEGLLAEEENED